MIIILCLLKYQVFRIKSCCRRTAKDRSFILTIQLSRWKEENTGFTTEVMKAREKLLMPCAPDFWGWPYLYGQDNFEIMAVTSDTGSEVRIRVGDGKLISYKPLNVIVLNEGQHGEIRFFRSEENVRQWQRDHPDGQGIGHRRHHHGLRPDGPGALGVFQDLRLPGLSVGGGDLPDLRRNAAPVLGPAGIPPDAAFEALSDRPISFTTMS